MMSNPIQILDPTLNHNFITTQIVNLINETYSFTQLEKGKKLRTCEGIPLDYIKGMEFVKWKLDLITWIKNSNRDIIQKRLNQVKQQLCRKCKRGFKRYEVKCSKDYKIFIMCEYMQRSLTV